MSPVDTHSKEFLHDSVKMGEALMNCVEGAWNTSLGWEPLRLIGCKHPICNEEETWLGSVAFIGGSWSGTIKIGLPKVLAILMTQRILQTSEVSDQEINDFLREFANMIAGSFKALLPGHCALGTPGSFVIKNPAGSDEEFPPLATIWFEFRTRKFFASIIPFEA